MGDQNLCLSRIHFKHPAANPFISCSSVGNYRDHIIETLKAVGQPTDEAHIISSLFDCLGGGDIRYRDYCGRGCAGVGSKDADYCL